MHCIASYQIALHCDALFCRNTHCQCVVLHCIVLGSTQMLVSKLLKALNATQIISTQPNSWFLHVKDHLKTGGAAAPTLASGSASCFLQPWPSPWPSCPPQSRTLRYESTDRSLHGTVVAKPIPFPSRNSLRLVLKIKSYCPQIGVHSSSVVRSYLWAIITTITLSISSTTTL